MNDFFKTDPTSYQQATSHFFEEQESELSLEDYLESKGLSSDDVEVYDIQEGKNSIAVDFDNGGSEEKILIDYRYKGRRFVGPMLLCSDSALDILNQGADPASEHENFWAAELTKEHQAPQQVIIADVNGDGRKDLIFSGVQSFMSVSGEVPAKEGLRIFINEIEEGSLDQETHIQHQNNVAAVPEYDRTGYVELTSGQWETEYLLDNLEAEHLVEAGYLTSDQAASLPQGFSVGTHQSEVLSAFAPFRASTTSQRLKDEDLPVDDNSEYETWGQDLAEWVVSDEGKITSVLPPYGLNGAGGNITYFRNMTGDLFVTATDQEIKDVQEMFFQKQQVVSYEQAKEILAIQLGVEPGNLVLLPLFENLAHLDQQIFFPMDGKAIVMRPPLDNPQYDEWLEAIAKLKRLGVEVVSEIDIPDNYYDRTRTPLNILVHRDAESGIRKYFIPLDPILSIDPESGEIVDFRTDPVDIPQTRVELMEFMFKNKTDLIMIYDEENLPFHVSETRLALIAAGVNPDDIVVFPHNGVGRGSLHCVTNVRPQAQDAGY